MNYNDLTASQGVVLIEFFATWCPHCRRMAPVVGQVKALVAGKAEVVQLDIDKNTSAADAAGVESVPTFLLYRDGKLLWRQSGEIEADSLLEKVGSAF